MRDKAFIFLWQAHALSSDRGHPPSSWWPNRCTDNVSPDLFALLLSPPTSSVTRTKPEHLHSSYLPVCVCSCSTKTPGALTEDSGTGLHLHDICHPWLRPFRTPPFTSPTPPWCWPLHTKCMTSSVNTVLIAVARPSLLGVFFFLSSLPLRVLSCLLYSGVDIGLAVLTILD